MSQNQISSFLLERYHIGEVTADEKLRVENALTSDAGLAEALAGLERADNEFKQRFPLEKFLPNDNTARHSAALRAGARFNVKNSRKVSPVIWGLCAAAVVLIVAIPLLVMRNSFNKIDDRMKGAVVDSSDIELSVYLRDNFAGEIIKLADQADIHSGNTIQLAYYIQDASSEKYGVIFSIDGRSSVTMHYPYSEWQSTQLDCGRAVPLEEAYTLDDAPDYEIFFFVVDDEPVQVEDILNEARQLAAQIAQKPQDVIEQGAEVFKDYRLEILTLRKEDSRRH